MALKFKLEETKEAPKAKSKVAEIPELKEALEKLPVGKNFLIPTADVETNIARVHVQRAQKDRTDVKLVTRSEKDKGLRVYAVAAAASE